MKQLPNDVVVGGAYQLEGSTVYVTGVKSKGRGFYVEFRRGPDDYVDKSEYMRLSLEAFRRACNVNQREVA